MISGLTFILVSIFVSDLYQLQQLHDLLVSPIYFSGHHGCQFFDFRDGRGMAARGELMMAMQMLVINVSVIMGD